METAGADSGLVPKPVIEDITVVVPTLGRPSLEGCLESLLRGTAWPATVVLVDQGTAAQVEGWVDACGAAGLTVRRVRSDRRGTAAAMNLALEHVTTRFVAVTHDDCHVGLGWLDAITEALRAEPRTLITGRVLPEGDEPVPGVITSTQPALYARPPLGRDPLFPDNMGVALDVARRIGPFDERPPLKLAEDAEWAYRALRLGVPIAFDPRPVVTHLAWRDAAARAVTYRGYVNSSGAFYGVYLRRGDWFLGLRAAYDLTRGVWMWLRGIMTGSADLAAYGRAYLTDLLPGVWTGLRLP